MGLTQFKQLVSERFDEILPEDQNSLKVRMRLQGGREGLWQKRQKIMEPMMLWENILKGTRCYERHILKGKPYDYWYKVVPR